GVTRYLDATISSHVFGVPKENPRFWEAVREVEPFDPAKSLFVDDSPPVLRAARAAGIRWVCGVRRADSVRAPRDHQDGLAVDSVSDLDPSRPWKGVLPGAPDDGLSRDERPSVAGVADTRARPAGRP